MDLYGVKPLNKKGEYFRQSVGGKWPELWQLISVNCKNILSQRDIKMGRNNNGHFISKEKALKIADTLKKILSEKSEHTFSGEDEGWHNLFWERTVKPFSEFCENSGGFRIY